MKLPLIQKNSELKPFNIIVIFYIIILLPFILLSVPFYYIFLKPKYSNLVKLLLSAITFFIYFLLLAGLYFYKNPNTLTINSVNVFLFDKNAKSEILNPTAKVTVLPNEGVFFVTRVIDGDTIEISTGEKVRYIGINAPELTNRNECFAGNARQKNVSLVLNKKVKLVKDVSDKDRYGRLLRYVYIDKLFVNKTLVEEGYANAATYPPDVKFKDLFVQMQKQAQEQKKGLWNECFR